MVSETETKPGAESGAGEEWEATPGATASNAGLVGVNPFADLIPQKTGDENPPRGAMTPDVAAAVDAAAIEAEIIANLKRALEAEIKDDREFFQKHPGRRFRLRRATLCEVCAGAAKNWVLVSLVDTDRLCIPAEPRGGNAFDPGDFSDEACAAFFLFLTDELVISALDSAVLATIRRLRERLPCVRSFEIH